MTPFGGPHLLRVTPSSHDERGYLTKNQGDMETLNRHLVAKIESRRDQLELVEADLQEGAETLLVGYGVTAGAIKETTRTLRSAGEKVSSLIIYSLWPVPRNAIRKALAGIKRVLVAEMNLGLYRREIERLAKDGQEISGVIRMDGNLVTPTDILTQGGLQ